MTTPSSPDPAGAGRPYEPFPAGMPRYVPAGGRPGPGHGPGYGPVRPGAPVPPPPELKRLLSLTLLSAALYLVNGVVSAVLMASTDLGAMYERMGLPAEEAEQAGAMATRMNGLTVVSTLGGLIVALGLYALVFFFLKKGANWARILGIVLAVVSAVSTLLGFLGAVLYGAWAVVLIAIGVAFVVVNVLWIVTAVKAPLRDWFTRPAYVG